MSVNDNSTEKSKGIVSWKRLHSFVENFCIEIEKILKKLGFNENESSGIKAIVESFEKDEWFDGGLFGIKIRNLIKDFTYKGKKSE